MKSIRLVSENEKEYLKKYFWDYLVELFQFDPTIVYNEYGVPIYRWYDCYWQQKGRYPFAFNTDGGFAGLALVRQLAPKRYEIAEFYVLPEFRKDNNAIDFALQITKRFDGEFTFSTRLQNLRAVKFWDKFAAKFACGNSSTDGDYKTWFVTTNSTTLG